MGVFGVVSLFSSLQVSGLNAWYRPMKFALSTTFFSWAMAWYCYYLPDFRVNYFNISVIILLGFEIVYIAIQAGRGYYSDYNWSSPMYSVLIADWHWRLAP